jgi:hypothetical protein
MDSNRIKLFIILGLTGFMAVFLGQAAATDQTQALIWVGAGIALATVLGLGRRVWILIPATAGLVGVVNMVPGAPSAWYLGVGMGGGMMFLRFLLRSQDFIWRWTWMDSLIALQVAVLAQAYVRNPTGLSILGGEMAGGRAYIEYMIGIAGFFALSFIKIDAEMLKRTILIFIVVSLGDSLLQAVSGFIPSLAYVVSRVYSNVDYAAAASAMGEGTFEMSMETRFGSLASAAQWVALICLSFHRPITCLMPIYPGRFISFALASVAILFSGFRSGLVKIAMYFIASCAVKRKPLDLMAALLVGLMLLATLAVSDQIRNLPFAVQRVLSFLPVAVDDAARSNAEGSSEWRFEMWRMVLTGDRYIKNKFLGDGFGFSAIEQTAFFNAQAKQGYMSYEENMDYFITKGSFHGFHVEAIRFTGILGLLVATVILVVFAFIANKQIKFFRNTPLEGYICLICIPILIEPVYYWFVFGSYKSGFIKYILIAGILKMIDNVRVLEIQKAKVAQEAEAAQPSGPEKVTSTPPKRSRVAMAYPRKKFPLISTHPDTHP